MFGEGNWLVFAQIAGAFGLMGFVIGIMIGQKTERPAGALAARSKPRQQQKEQSRGGGSNGRGAQSQGGGGDRDRGGDRDSEESFSGASGTGRGVELYVGNLPYETSDKELGRAFEKFGRVLSVRMIENRRNGRPKGFGFVEMEDDASADSAIKSMNGADFKGRAIVVNEAKSRARRD